MQRAIEILSVFFVALGVVWFLLAQASGILQGANDTKCIADE
jgi:hypothetical protein